MNKLVAGPILTDHFADLFGQKGWYLRWTDELMSYDWNAKLGRDDASRQCLVSDGFETKIGRAEKAKSSQTKKFAIHTLGHEATLGSLLG